nr:unnamed protein product [Callosobruchus analis]
MEFCTKCKKACDSTIIFPCDSCNKLFCATCGDLTASEIKCLQLKNKRKLKFYCDACEEGLCKVPSLIKEVADLKDSVNKINEMLSRERINNNSANNSNCNMEDIISEMLDRQNRATNVIMYNMNESVRNTQTERIHEELVLRVLSELPVEKNNLKFNPKIILTSESRTTQDVEDIEIQMEGYNAVRCDSSTRHTGGVIIYVRSGLNFFIIKTFVCDVYGISQAITKPTRITPDSESLIDYVLVNKNNVIANVHDSPKVTDHAVISVNFTNEFKSDCNSVKKYRNVCLDNLNSIQNELISCKWSLDSMDVNLLYKEVYSNCENIINKISPIQVCTFRNNLPWLDNEVSRMMQIRDTSYKNFKVAVGMDRQNKWEIYKSQRNKVVNLLKVKKEKYYYEKIDRYRNNPYQMWKTLKNVVNMNSPAHPMNVEFVINDNIVTATNIVQLAEQFNSFFC